MLQVTRVLAAIAVTVGGFTASEAQAGHHRSLVYTGQRVGCHAESQLISALTLLDSAYQSPHFRRGAALSAHRLAESALNCVCSRRSEQEILLALDEIDHYLACRSPAELAYAADHLVAALQIEQALHQPQPVVFHRHRHAVPYGSSVQLGVQRGGFYLQLGARSPAQAVLSQHYAGRAAAGNVTYGAGQAVPFGPSWGDAYRHGRSGRH